MRDLGKCFTEACVFEPVGQVYVSRNFLKSKKTCYHIGQIVQKPESPILIGLFALS